jgi:hypothetical protein
MVGAEIADPIVYGLIPVGFVMVVSLVAFIVLGQWKSDVRQTETDGRVDGNTERIAELERRVNKMIEQDRGGRRREGPRNG